ncbi:MAG TPA: transposase [Caulobacteraceae bacterium]|nr:transposase [Caulobacteraceae bacterium]
MLPEAFMFDKKYLGVDVAAEWIDAAFHGQDAVERIANTPEAIASWLGKLRPEEIGLVAFEPTGGYERTLRRQLAAQGLAFARVHPNELAAFRRRRGRKAKTDAIDARLLADFAAAELAGRGLAPMVEGDEALREMTARRRQLVEFLTPSNAAPARPRPRSCATTSRRSPRRSGRRSARLSGPSTSISPRAPISPPPPSACAP